MLILFLLSEYFIQIIVPFKSKGLIGKSEHIYIYKMSPSAPPPPVGPTFLIQYMD